MTLDAARRACLLAVVTASGCGGSDQAGDPLDPELVRELSTARGSASGDDRSGAWVVSFETRSCDCPRYELDGQTVDLCDLSSFAAYAGELELVEGSGVLAILLGSEGELGVLSGAIESDGSFVVAGLHDASTLLGPLESIRRVDGQFEANDQRAEGWAGQRLLGEVGSDDIDCRWLGDFVAARP